MASQQHMSTSPTRPAHRRVPFPIFDDEDAIAFDPAQLPSDHFLAQRPVTPPRPDSVIDAAWIDGARPDTSSLAAADYDVSVATGFLPPEEPVQSLRGLGWGWDALEDSLEEVERVAAIKGGAVGKISEQWMLSVRQLPRASIEPLTTLPLLRRAHMMLAHLLHFYMHGTFPAQTVVPASLAVPLVAVSDRLGLPPILTYADTVLWTWRLTDKALGLRADNVEITTTFTQTPSERAFFLLSLFCELHGPSILRLMSATLDEVFFADRTALARIAGYLQSIAALVDELTTLMAGAVKGSFGPNGRECIVPEVFYWEIRPWFNGGKWVYKGVGPHGEDKEMEWGGPSAGQSSLVHALDLFLGVDHMPRAPGHAHGHGHAHRDEAQAQKVETAAFPSTFHDKHDKDTAAAVREAAAGTTSTAALHKAPSDATFMQRMSHYMPGHHRAFLSHLESLHSPNPDAPHAPVLPSLRSLAHRHPAELGAAYDTAVSAMKRFRDSHMRLATVFIVQQARREPARESVHWAEWEAKRLAKERAEEERRMAGQGSGQEEKLVGTGGTDLVSFLKRCRDRTIEALLGDGEGQN